MKEHKWYFVVIVGKNYEYVISFNNLFDLFWFFKWLVGVDITQFVDFNS